MSSINIGGQQNDAFYRYKMPKLQAVIDRRNHGGATVLVNIEEVAKALHRPAIYITKFFGYELSTAVQTDTKKNRHAVRGAHQQEILQSLIEKFIEKFVICAECGNPETEFVFGEKQGTELCKLCIACGRQLPDNMQSHKLTGLIVKDLRNNPNAVRRDTTPEDSPTEVVSDEDSASLADRLVALIEAARTEHKLQDIDTINDILIDADQYNLVDEVPLIAAKCLFTANILQEIDAYKLLFGELCKKNEKGQGYLLHSLEALINDRDDIRERILNKKSMAAILYKLYDESIVSEKVFRRWHAKTSSRFADPSISGEIRVMSQAFLDWLDQPDASDDDDPNGQ